MFEIINIISIVLRYMTLYAVIAILFIILLKIIVTEFKEHTVMQYFTAHEYYTFVQSYKAQHLPVMVITVVMIPYEDFVHNYNPCTTNVAYLRRYSFLRNLLSISKEKVLLDVGWSMYDYISLTRCELIE